MVGDGHAMGIAAQVVEHILGATEGWFGVDDPVFSEQRSQPGSEDLRLRERILPDSPPSFSADWWAATRASSFQERRWRRATTGRSPANSRKAANLCWPTIPTAWWPFLLFVTWFTWSHLVGM